MEIWYLLHIEGDVRQTKIAKMKYEQNTSPILASNEIANTSSVMGMTLDGALEMTKHLRDTVYSNKVLAIVRELASNAIDEHVLHGVDKDVEISLNYNDSQLQIRFRDYAKGLSEDGVRNIFGMYGNSTKRNNNIQVGCLGIGSKSPFCYTSSYFVVSYFGGEKTLYSCSLGGNEQGTSVGFIHKIHSEPSNETGLEIIVDVKEHDSSKFKEEIVNFVALSPHKIHANIFGETISPLKELKRIKKEDFVVRVLEDADYFKKILTEQSSCELMMGGVRYGEIQLPKKLKQKKSSFFVVDVNIGQMTVTLSRESFHETPLNTAFKNKISAFLEELAKKDLESFAAMGVDKLVGDALATSDLKRVEGEYFSAHLSNIHADIWPLIDQLETLNQEKNLVKKGTKNVLVLMHETNSWSWKNYWFDKARKLAKDNNTNYYISYAKVWNKLTPEAQAKLESYFSPVGIKTLPYPKDKSISVSGVGYACYYSNGRSIGKHTPLSFLNWMIKTKIDCNHSDFKTVAEGQDWLKAKKKNIKGIGELKELSFSSQGGRYVSCWQTRSAKFLKEANELGFFIYGDSDSQKIRQKITEQQEIERKKSQEISNAKKKFVQFHPRTLRAITKIKNAKKINSFFEKLMKETSLRKKTLATFNVCHELYYSCDKIVLDRHELRKILQLK